MFNNGMKRLFTNLLKSTAIFAMAGLLGWYTHQSFGIVGVLTNVVFFAMGALWVATWDRGKNKSEPSLDAQSLSETATAAPVVENTASVETPATSPDPMSSESS